MDRKTIDEILELIKDNVELFDCEAIPNYDRGNISIVSEGDVIFNLVQFLDSKALYIEPTSFDPLLMQFIVEIWDDINPYRDKNYK